MTERSVDHKELQCILGSVIDAAVRNQKTAKEVIDQLSEAISTIQSASSRLPNFVSKEVGKQLEEATEGVATKLLQRFDSANVSAERARIAYENSTKSIFKWIVLPALAITAICASTMLGTVIYLTPSISEIENKRYELNLLNSQIGFIEALKNVEISQCNTARGKLVVCARFDPRDQRSWNGYRAIVERR